MVFFAEVQYVENPGCDQYGIKKKAEREQMKNYNLYIYFLHFALTLKFRKYVFTREQAFKVPVSISVLPHLLPNPIVLYAGKADFLKKSK